MTDHENPANESSAKENPPHGGGAGSSSERQPGKQSASRQDSTITRNFNLLPNGGAPPGAHYGNGGGEPPRPIQGDLDKLPEALEPLMRLPNWVIWKFVQKGGKWTKPPFDARRPHRNARNNDARTWASYEQALRAAKSGEFAQHGGIGFCLFGSGFGAFDLDHCRDKDTGVIDRWALDIVEQVGSYTETSPSGTGLRIVGKITSTEKLHRQFPVHDPSAKPDAKCETYRNCERYITITGLQIDGTPDVLANIDASIETISAQFDGGDKKPKSRPDAVFSKKLPVVDIATLDLSELGAKAADVREMIEHGETPKHKFPSRSEAVWFVLLNLARAGVSPDEMLSIILDERFEISAHVRDQAEPVRYAERQVRNAIAKVAELPHPQPSSNPNELTGRYRFVPRYGEDKLAQKVVDLHGGSIRHVEKWGKWLIWNGVVWAEDETGRIIDDYIRAVCWEMADQLVREDAKKFARLAAKLVSSSVIHAVKKLVQSIAPVAATVYQWDRDPWLLNTPGGVVDLKTGELRAHRPEDLYTAAQ